MPRGGLGWFLRRKFLSCNSKYKKLPAIPRCVRTLQAGEAARAQASGSNACGMFEKNVTLEHGESVMQESDQKAVEAGRVGRWQGARIY